MDEAKEHKLEINLPEAKAGGDYSNLAVVTHSPSEFVLDFCQMMPGTPKANVVSRIILNPMHAKALFRTLGANIERFEATFGEIRELAPPPQAAVSLNQKKKLPN